MIYFYLFIYASILFSFIHVAAQSFPIREKFLFRFSKCDYCEKALTFVEIVPIFSYLFQKGKTKCCDQQLKKTYILLEIISPVVILIFYTQFQWGYDFLLITLVFSFLTFFLLTDIYYMHVPVSVLFLFFICSLLFSFRFTIFEYILIVALNICVYFICKKGIGSGDIFILITLGFFFGSKGMYIILFVATVLAILIVGSLYFFKRISARAKFPFVPFIYAGFLIYVIYIFSKG